MTLSGTIVDLSGEPVPGVEVHAGYTYHELPIATSVTASDGSFTMPVTTEWEFPFQVGDADALGLVGGFLAVDGTLIDGYETMRRFEAVPGYVDLGDIQLRQGHEVGGTVTVAGLPTGATTEARLLFSPGGADYTYREELIRIGNGANPWSIVLPDGEFGIRLSASSHAIFTYPSSGEGPVEVDGAAVSDVDFTVEMSGRTITGTVVDVDGLTVGGAHVSLAPVDFDGQHHWTTTADDGTYALGGVRPDTYRLSFSFQNGPTTYWDGAASYEEADPIVILDSTPNLTGYDAVVYRGASVTGTSTGPDGTPRSGDVVTAYRNGTMQSTAYTLSDGTFTFTGLPAGDYSFTMEQGGWGGLLQYFDGATTAEEATVVPLAEGVDVDGVDFVSRKGASIAGIVALGDGTPVEGAVVRAFAANDQDSPIAEAKTDASGAYEIDELNANNYALAVSGGTPLIVSRWFGGTGARSDATAISLGAEDSAAADFEVDLGATIRGTVILPEGESYASLLAWETTSSADSLWIGLSSDEPGAEIEWALPGLPAGMWRVSASSGNAWVETADIPLAAGDEVAGIVIDLSGPAQLSGDVTLKGEPDVSLAGRVTLLDAAEESVAEDWIDSGRYSFSKVAPGVYTMVVQAEDWNGGVTRIAQTEVEIPSEGSPPVGLDVEVEPGIPVGGRVFDAATGSPVSGANLDWNRETGIGWLWSHGWGYGATTGEFELTVDDPGIVELSASAEFQDYSGTSIDVDVPEPGVEGLEIGLTKGASVSGRVVSDNNGVPLSNVSVELVDEDGSWRYSGYTDSDGRYTVHGVLAGTYRVEFTNYSGLYVSEWFDDQPSSETAAEITVGSEPLSGIDAALSLGSVITGTVTGPEGAPIPWAEVGLAVPPTPVEAFFGFVAEVFGAEPTIGRLLDVTATTDENGAFRFPAVPAGQYAIYVRESGHRTTWYDGKSTLDTADLVTTSTGGVATVPLTAELLGEGETSLAPEQTLTSEFAVTLHPDDTSAAEGEWVELRAAASGSPVPSIEWERRAPGGEWESLGLGDVYLGFAAELALDGYEYRAVFTQGGATLTSDAATLTVRAAPTVPDAPAAPTVGDITSSGATISWMSPPDNGAAISGYSVRLFDAGSDVPIRTLELGATTQQVIGGLVAATDYDVEVTARNAVGSSDASARTAFTTADAPPLPDEPGPPTGVVAVAGDRAAEVSWAAPADDGGSPITGYTVTASPGGVTATAGAGATSVMVGGLVNGTAYTFVVKATNAVGDSSASAPSAPVTPEGATEPVDPVVERLWGATRFETAANISAANFEPGVSVVYVASGLGFPDALAGAPVAGANDAPVLLVSRGVPSETAAELERLKPAKIVILGGEAVVSKDVAAQLAEYTDGAVERLWGATRYATAANISAANFAPGVPVAYVASGLGFPDALAGAPVAGANDAPVLLVSRGVPSETAAELERLKPAKIVILGGEAVVSKDVATQLEAFLD
ncbi:carboxypeptidase regulatory-like domain-containing protein [Agromyces luteolus]|uniref:carboxypeptidase regulatory-like domain-containing protein n=2 Tax=Agromyces luteolus TaxID=88373 RepID=UPI0031D0207B